MTIPSATVPRLPWDAADPFPFYERCRRSGDIVWDDTAQTWLILGYHKAQQVLSGTGWTHDPLTSPNARTVRDSIGPELFSQSMLVSDGTAHQRLRRAARDAFAPAFITSLGDGVDAIAETVISQPETGEVFDFIAEVALPLPLAVIGEWLGIDAASTRLLRDQAPAVIEMLVPLATAEEVTAAMTASVTLVTHFLPMGASRRENPGEDLLSFLVSDPDLSLDEAVLTAVHIAIGSFQTIGSLLGAAALRLLTPGADGTRLVDTLNVSDPSLITELLRLDAPAQAIPRTATETQRIGDVKIAAGQQVVVVIGAANRDPAVYDEPAEFRLGRPGPAPLTFGHGPHHCLGAALARLETEAALRRMLARDPFLAGPATWRDSPPNRGPIRLPMRFGAPQTKPPGNQHG